MSFMEESNPVGSVGTLPRCKPGGFLHYSLLFHGVYQPQLLM